MAVIVSISGVVVALAIGWFSALRAQYDRVLEVLRYVSSDAVASARQQLGLIIHSERRKPVDTTARHDRIADLFVVLWAFGRIDAVRQTLPRWELPAFLGGGPLLLLKTNTKAWVMYWHTHLAAVLSALEPDVDIRGSDDGFRRLEEVWLQP